ncbi:MAG: hypothetical protein LUG95_04100 [Clostridiales bacterium]|nr:hypothetical protein [Clostridiales bacterium]
MKRFKNLRYTTSIVVFLIVLAVPLLMAGLYFLLVFLKLIPHGTVLSPWVPVIVIVSCSCIGALGASIFSSYFLKPLDEVTDAVKILPRVNLIQTLKLLKAITAT